MTSTIAMTAAARARGLDVLSYDDETDAVTIGVSLITEVVLFADNSDQRGDVHVVVVHPTWTYQEGPGSVDYEFGTLPLPEALSYVAWVGKAEATREDRAEAEMHPGSWESLYVPGTYE